MSYLSDILEFAFRPDETVKARVLSKVKDERIRTLLQTEEITSTTLVQEEVWKTVIEGSEPAIAMREALPVLHSKGSALRVVLGETGSYAEEIAEGAAVPFKNQSYTKVTFDWKRVGDAPPITQILIDDALFDVVELEFKKSGRRIENKLNRDAINTIIGNASGGVAYNGSEALKAIAQAVKTVWTADHSPDTIVMSPTFAGAILEDTNFVYANRAGTDKYFKTGKLDTTILGLTPYVCAVTTSNNSWGNGVKAIVYEKNAVGAIGINGAGTGIRVEDYKDPLRDIVTAVSVIRYDVKNFFGAAACNIS